MKVATYNLWNFRTHRSERLAAACEELSRLDADVVALQEAAMRIEEAGGCNAARYIADRCGYAHIATRPYPNDPDEGLVFLSKHPLRDVEAGWNTGFAALKDCGLRVRVSVGRVEVAITNVHLNWNNILTREGQISQVLRWIEVRSEEGCYELLCGDFNCPPDSSVYRFLMGQQTPLGRGISPWHDLAHYQAEKVGRVPSPTLDFWNNPRWRDTPR